MNGYERGFRSDNPTRSAFGPRYEPQRPSEDLAKATQHQQGQERRSAKKLRGVEHLYHPGSKREGTDQSRERQEHAHLGLLVNESIHRLIVVRNGGQAGIEI